MGWGWFLFIMILFLVICPLYIALKWVSSIWSTVLILIFAAIFFFSWLAFFSCLFGLIIDSDSDSDYNLDLVLLSADAAVCIIGFLISLFVICTFVDEDYGLKTLGWILLGTVILGILLCIVAVMGTVVRILSLLGAVVYIVILTMWTIGFHLSYDIKCNYDNVAYYECTEMKVESWRMHSMTTITTVASAAWVPERLNGDIYDQSGYNVTKISEEHIIGTYEVGDHLEPSGEGIRTYDTTIFQTAWTTLWYGVLTDDGESGWTPASGLAVYYWNSRDYVTEKREEKLQSSWYCWMPQSWLNACESFFESQEHSYKYNLAD